MAEQIEISEEILTFFKQRGRYVPQRITYDAVVGKCQVQEGRRPH